MTIYCIMEEILCVEGIENVADMARRKRTLERVLAMAAAAGRKMPNCVVALQRLPQCSVKLHRWLPPVSLLDRIAWDAAMPRLSTLYATL